MKGSIRMEGVAEYSALMGRMAAGLGRTTGSVLRQEARGLCVEFGAATLPGPGFSEGKAEAFRRRVEAEVRQVFPTAEQGTLLVALVGRRSRDLARGLSRVMRENPGGWMRDPQALRYLREAGVGVERLDPAVHRAARTGRQASVPRSYVPTGVVAKGQAGAYVRRKRESVGTAKAGWYAAAVALGGRVRRNTVDATSGKRGTVEIFPSYVRKLARRYPGLGGAEVSETRVVVFSNVRHAVEALPERFYDRAVRGARTRLRAALLRGAQELRKGRGRRAA